MSVGFQSNCLFYKNANIYIKFQKIWILTTTSILIILQDRYQKIFKDIKNGAIFLNAYIGKKVILKVHLRDLKRRNIYSIKIHQRFSEPYLDYRGSCKVTSKSLLSELTARKIETWQGDLNRTYHQTIQIFGELNPYPPSKGRTTLGSALCECALGIRFKGKDQSSL